jgi:hypothetical protein
MLNKQISQLGRLPYGDIHLGDLIPIVDTSSLLSETGETDYVTVLDLADYLIENGFLTLTQSYQGFQMANGLSFDENTTIDDPRYLCSGTMQSLGNEYSLCVRGYVSSDMIYIDFSPRILFGVGSGITTVGDPNSAYIGVANSYDLVAQAPGLPIPITYPGYFSSTLGNKAFGIVMTRNTDGLITMYVNGIFYASISGSSAPMTNSNVIMGAGRLYAHNLKHVIYEAQVFKNCLSAIQVNDLFYRGVDPNDDDLIASYNSITLNETPSQWLDDVGYNHILLPISGAMSTNPGKRFLLSFYTTGSGYLGGTPARNVLPVNYVLTSCIVESAGKPLLSIGSNPTPSSPGDSGTGSYWDNRVSFTSASYGVNPLKLLPQGIAHADRTIWVQFSASAAPCAITFDGFIRD